MVSLICFGFVKCTESCEVLQDLAAEQSLLGTEVPIWRTLGETAIDQQLSARGVCIRRPTYSFFMSLVPGGPNPARTVASCQCQVRMGRCF